MLADRHLTMREFLAGTPSVPAERITCRACGDEYIGDPANEPVCPNCTHSDTIGGRMQGDRDT